MIRHLIFVIWKKLQMSWRVREVQGDPEFSSLKIKSHKIFNIEFRRLKCVFLHWLMFITFNSF